MDALALLCTLHADGPATLKRLRAIGCSNLGAVAAVDTERLADGLGIQPAAARRLAREAKLLIGRLGHDSLDVEEAPPESAAAPSSSPPPAIPLESNGAPMADVPALGGARSGEANELEPSDLDLVSRIVGTRPAVAPVKPRTADEDPFAGHVSAPHDLAQHDLARHDAAPSDAVEPIAAPEPTVEPETVSVPEPVVAVETSPGDLVVGGLPGLDEPMLEDLHSAGLTTYAQVAAAESLSLTRNLGVTFAQARRLRFLARRAADVQPPVELPVESAVESAADAPVRDEVDVLEIDESRDLIPTPPRVDASSIEAHSSTEEVPAAEAPAAALASVEAIEAGADTGADTETGTGTDETDPSVADEAPEVDASDADGDRPYDRKAFWESRILAETSSALEGEESQAPQGERVDPSEIAPRPRFGEQFAKSMKEGRVGRPAATSGRTILGWNFEIPRPEAESLPFASLGPGAVQADLASAQVGNQADEGAKQAGGEAAGPFA